MTDKATELRLGLAQHTGSEESYRHSLFRRFRYTEGVQYLAETAGAYWLLDLVFSHQLTPYVADEEFQVWTLTVDVERGSGSIRATDGGRGDGQVRQLAEQDIPLTDFPLPEIKLFLEGTMLLLPSEH